MIAVGGEDCKFYAIVLSGNGEVEEKDYIDVAKKVNKVHQPYRRIYHNFIHPKEDERGAPRSSSYL